MPEEEKVCAFIAQETRHLMTFLPRKSFTQWQREELTAWIESNFDILAGQPFCPAGVSAALREEYNQVLLDKVAVLDENHQFHPDEIADMRAMVEAFLGDSERFSEQQLCAFLRDPASFYQYVEAADKEEYEGVFDEDELDEQFFEHLEEEFINSEHFQEQDRAQSKQRKK